MSEHEGVSLRSPRVLGAAGAIVGLILVLLYVSGALHVGKVGPGTVERPRWVADGRVQNVEQRQVLETVEWPGSVNSRLVANLAAKIVARVEHVAVRLGDRVERGQVLVRLDDREIRARVDQARAALQAAEAEAEHAGSDLRRVRALYEREATTAQERDAAEARARAAEAGRVRAQQALAEAEALLANTQIVAPFHGVVAARFVDPGDLATPGRPLLVVHDPESLRFEAYVAESAAADVRVGDRLSVRIHRPATWLEGHVEEIAPRAEATSRTVLIKLSLPGDAALVPGAYGSLEIPVGTRTATLLPAAAVVRRGQLEMVYVRDEGQTKLRMVRTGKAYGEWREVLSGLSPGMQVIVPR